MIKTLRITSVLAVIVAGVVLASVLVPSLVGFRVRGDGRTKNVLKILSPLAKILPRAWDDEQMGRLLSAPSAVDRFKEQHGDKDQSSEDTTPPLVREAERLADIMTPKPSPAAGVPVTPTQGPVRPTALPPTTSAKFGLVGTSYSPSNPAASCAFIRLADNTTYQWVQPGDQIAHYVVKEIKSGAIICWDGSRNTEIPIEPVPDTANMLETGAVSSVSAVSGLRQPIVPSMPGQVMTQPAATGQPVASTGDSPSAHLTTEDQEALSGIVDRLKELDSDPASRNAAAEKLISEFRSSRVSAEEAEKLGDLGEELNENKDNLKEQRRREFLRRLSAPQSIRN